NNPRVEHAAHEDREEDKGSGALIEEKETPGEGEGDGGKLTIRRKRRHGEGQHPTDEHENGIREAQATGPGGRAHALSSQGVAQPYESGPLSVSLSSSSHSGPSTPRARPAPRHWAPSSA